MKLCGHKRKDLRGLAILLAFLTATAPGAFGQPSEQSVFKPEELEQVLAPIALYPDSLLAQVLMASTYPLEIVQADRWAKQNKDLKGEALTGALEKQNWDPSVKSLVNFPQVLAMMSEKLDWTQKLGDAFLAQQKVNHDGVVYEKDLGKSTSKAAKEMFSFDPDKTWKQVD